MRCWSNLSCYSPKSNC